MLREKLRKEEAVIDWSQPAAVLHRRIRAFLPRPVACTTFRGKLLRLWGVEALESTPTTSAPGTLIAVEADGIRVATGAGALNLTRLQLEGGKVLSAHEFANGQRPAVGEQLDAPAPVSSR